MNLYDFSTRNLKHGDILIGHNRDVRRLYRIHFVLGENNQNFKKMCVHYNLLVIGKRKLCEDVLYIEKFFWYIKHYRGILGYRSIRLVRLHCMTYL